MFKDTGHYYKNGILMEDWTLSTCRKEGGIVSVTTILDTYTPEGLVFWKIAENVEAAYNVLDRAFTNQADLKDFRKMVADEFYRTHNHLAVGTAIHDGMAKLIAQAIPLPQFNDFWRAHTDSSVWDMAVSARKAYEWFLEMADGGEVETPVYDQDRFISGTADFSGRLKDDQGTPGLRGLDWKTKFIKKHPGHKADGEMKAVPVKKDPKHPMQLGAYGRVKQWEGGWIGNISTNPLIPWFKPVYYDHDAIIEGYQAFGHLNRTYRIINKFTEEV